jgi:hypothetical protein
MIGHYIVTIHDAYDDGIAVAGLAPRLDTHLISCAAGFLHSLAAGRSTACSASTPAAAQNLGVQDTGRGILQEVQSIFTAPFQWFIFQTATAIRPILLFSSFGVMLAERLCVQENRALNTLVVAPVQTSATPVAAPYIPSAAAQFQAPR